jgi:hypothetical protein
LAASTIFGASRCGHWGGHASAKDKLCRSGLSCLRARPAHGASIPGTTGFPRTSRGTPPFHHSGRLVLNENSAETQSSKKQCQAIRRLGSCAWSTTSATTNNERRSERDEAHPHANPASLHLRNRPMSDPGGKPVSLEMSNCFQVCPRKQPFDLFANEYPQCNDMGHLGRLSKSYN